MSLADKIVKVAIEGMPINPLEKLFIKFVLGTKLGRKILLKRMKKNWQKVFGKKGKVDKKKADKVAKGIVSKNKKQWPAIFDKVVLDEKPNTPKSPYEVHLNGENIVSDKEAEMPEMLRKILSLGAVVEPKTPKNPRANPYEVRINGEVKSVQEILKDMADTSLKDVLKDMHKENDYKFLQKILGDNINVKIESLEDLYAGKKKTKEDEKKAVNPYSDEALEKRGLEMQINQVPIGGYGYHEPLKYVKPLGDHIYMYRGAPVVECDGYYFETVIVPKGSGIWKGGYLHKKDFFERYHVDTNKDPLGGLAGINDPDSLMKYLDKKGKRLPDGKIYAKGALLPNDPRWAADDQKGFKFVDGQMILPDGTVVKLATSEAEKPKKEQIINPDQNKKLEKNPWVIHLDKVAQNFQKHEDYFKQKYGLTLDGGAIMPAHTNDISSTLVATKGGRQ